MKVDGDERCQYCPRCGAANKTGVALYLLDRVTPCSSCTWKIRWLGPLWGEAVR